MRSALMLAVITMAATSPAAVGAQDVEAAAVRDLLARGNLPRDRPLVLEARIAKAGHAPAVLGADRDPARSAAIARALDATVGSLADVRPRSTGAPGPIVIAVSDPERSGDTATITVTGTTVDQRGHGQYETVRYTLRRSKDGWVIVSAEQLGVS